MSKLLKSYLRVLDRHPWKTQMATTGALMATGDCLAQVFVEKKTFSQYDWQRTGRFLVFGTILTGPALRGWYSVLDIVVKTPAKWGPLAKMALDQSTFAPAFCAFFLYTMTLWTSRSTIQAEAKLKQDYTAVLFTNWKMWPAAQVINFYLIPFQHRVLYVNFVAVFWNTYLAYKTNTAIKMSMSS